MFVVPAGQRIVAAGERSEQLYLLAEGKVALIPAGSLEPWRRLGPGSAFGESALAGDGLSPYDAIAETEAQVLALDRAALVTLFKRHPESGLALLGRLAEAIVQALAARASPPSPAAGAAPLRPVTEEHWIVGESPAPAPSPWCVELPDGSSLPLAETDSDLLIGRPDPASGVTPQIDLGGHDPYRSLSRRHARLLRDGARWLLREEPGVVNGTFVNDRRLAPGEAVEVSDGDRMRFGAVEVVLRHASGATPQ
jgi:hypothetical protein